MKSGVLNGFQKTLAIAVCVTLVASNASAEPPSALAAEPNAVGQLITHRSAERFFKYISWHPTRLLANNSVQDDLDLDLQQKLKAVKLTIEAIQAQRDIGEDLV